MLTALVANAPTANAQSDDGLTLVELYTSQGCSSCPPANTVLGAVAARGDVLALSFSVDYWDYLGWRDTFARPEFTARQRAYMARMSTRSVYTPQMVIDGRFDVVGSNRSRVTNALDQAANDRAKRAPRVTPDIRMDAKTRNHVHVRIPDGAPPPDGAADIWYATYTPGRTVVRVRAGENRGRSVEHFNVVTKLARMGEWTGAARAFDIPLNPGEALAVFLQCADFGEIFSATTYRSAEADRAQASTVAAQYGDQG
ncbi:MAG: DUF1223 domain-containing protein [Maricaulaceae bacterium]